MVQRFFAWVQRYERHLSALAMLTGFVVDNIFFDRVDLWQTHLVFAVYTAVCFVTIPLLHWLETSSSRPPRVRLLLPLATQFALGGLWSGFVIFYGRAADLTSSWAFLLFLIGVLVANEYFREYHTRLVFTSVLFFFALYSYALFALPIAMGTITAYTFFLSGIVAVLVFAVFVRVLKFAARERFLTDIWRIRAGAACVFIAMNVFYFTNVLPPLPLAASAAGIYHSVWRVPGDYMALEESKSWTARYLGRPPTLHVPKRGSVYAYSSVFAPTDLQTSIIHRWEWHNPQTDEWETRASISYPITGGRALGYRGYSALPMTTEGKWRVRVETVDKRVITDLPFTVVFTESPPTLITTSLP